MTQKDINTSQVLKLCHAICRTPNLVNSIWDEHEDQRRFSNPFEGIFFDGTTVFKQWSE